MTDRKLPLVRATLFAALGLIALPAQVFPSPSWPQATPESQGLDSTILAQGIAALPWPANNGPLIVIANGHEVFRVGDVTQPVPTFSCSKLVTGMVVARLIEQNRIASLDARVPNTHFTGAWSGYPGDATYRQFLSMTSDYGLTPYQPAGGQYAYNNNAIDFCGESISRQFYGIGPDRMHDVAQQAIFSIIGRQDSIGFAGQWGGWSGGLEVSTRDFARLGYLVLRDGVWNGRRVLAQEFVDGLFRSQIPASATAYQGTPNQADQWNQQAVTDRMAGSWSFGLWRAGQANANGDWSFAVADGYRGKRLILCPAGSLPNPSLEVVIACLPPLPDEGPANLDYIDIVANAARALLPHVPSDPNCVAATFEDGTLSPLEARYGQQSVVAGRWRATGSARALLPNLTYDNCDALVSIAPGMPLDSSVGIVLRAERPGDDAWRTDGEQSYVRLQRDANGTFRVQVLHYENGQPIWHTSPPLTAARADRAIEMLVVARGDALWCTVEGESALGANGYRGIPAPAGGGHLSLRSQASSGRIEVQHFLARSANGPRAHVWIDALGDHELVIFEPDFLSRFDGNSFAVLVDEILLGLDGFGIVQPYLWPTLAGIGRHHLVLSSRAAPFTLQSGTRIGMAYRGLVEGETLP